MILNSKFEHFREKGRQPIQQDYLEVDIKIGSGGK